MAKEGASQVQAPVSGACLSIPREPRWQGRISVRCSWAWPTPLDPCTGADARRTAPAVVVLRNSRATPQTPQRTDPPARPNTMVALEQSALPTLRDRADFPSCGVVASLLGHYPTASAPPCLRGNLPRSRPRRILRQARNAMGETRMKNRSRSLLGFAAAAACVCLCAGLCAAAADRYDAAVAHAGRSAADVKRDALDHPAEILRVTGIGPGMRVADVLAGDGYYSELASYLVGPKGHVLLINNAAFDTFSDGDRQKRLEGGRLPNVEHQTVDLNDMHLPRGTLDAVLLIKVYHDLY